MLASVLLLIAGQAHAGAAHAARAARARPVVEAIVSRVEARFRSGSLAKYETETGELHEDGMIFVADPARAKVMTLMQADALIQFLEDDEFKNLHQTGYSGGGGDDAKIRAWAEKKLAGLNIDTLVRGKALLAEILPKYGMVEFHDFAAHPGVRSGWAADVGTEEKLDSYGEIAVYFKPKVFSRATFTSLDSLDLTTRPPEDVGDLRDWVQSMRQAGLVLPIDQVGAGRFFEAQLWGPVGVDDVDYVVVPTELWLDDSASIGEVLASLARAGLPAYQPKDRLTPDEHAAEALRARQRGKRWPRLAKPPRKWTGD